MLRHLVIDPQTGMAGDMFVAALISAGAPEDETLASMCFAAGLLGKAKIRTKKAGKKDLAGLSLEMNYKPDNQNIPMAEMAAKLERSIFHAGIAGEYALYARRVLHILSDAEIRAHASIDSNAEAFESIDDGDSSRRHKHKDTGAHPHSHKVPMLHEAQDILVDITGGAFALQALGVSLDSVTCLSPVYVGGGFVTFSHGTFPVPAPAVCQVIKACNIPTAGGPAGRELLTPTGVSILAALGCRYEHRREAVTLVRHEGRFGAGFGMMKLPGGMPNAVLVRLIDDGDSQ